MIDAMLLGRGWEPRSGAGGFSVLLGVCQISRVRARDLGEPP